MAYVVHEPNRPQEGAQPVHGSGARVQDHDPGTSQLSSETVSRTAPPGSEPSEDDGNSPPSMEQSEAAAPATPSLTTTKCTQEMLENTTLVTQFGKEDTAGRVGEPRGSHPSHSGERRSHRNQVRSVSRIDTSQSYRDEGIRDD